MKHKHICFESIPCKDLSYIEASNSWVCLYYFYDIKSCDFCQQCRFMKLKAMEDAIRKAGKRG